MTGHHDEVTNPRESAPSATKHAAPDLVVTKCKDRKDVSTKRGRARTRAHARAGGPSEKEFQASVVELAALLGYEPFHPRVMIGSSTGWPDLVLVGRRIIFAELKRSGAKPTKAQVRWHSLLEAAGGEVYLWEWHPRILDEIHEVLR